MKPEKMPIGVPVKQAKLKDIAFLLQKHFGEDWRSDGQLAFYKEILDRNAENRVVDDEDSDDDFNELEEENEML